MKNFNSSMADDYATSQSNLTNNQQQQQATAAQQQQAADNMNQQQQHQMPTDMEELEAERRALQQRAGSQLAGSRPQLIVDEMQQDLQYLAREAPLDGGESTFGAYSQLGGGSQHGISSGSIAGHEQGLLLRNEEGDDDLVGDYDNDPNRSSSRQDSESAALVANYARGSPLHRNLSETPTSASRFAVHNELALDSLAPDNVDIQRPLQQAGFLVSFMVDARGGAMRGCRHSGVRVIIPPNSAQMPMRITCRYLRRERLVHPPMLMEGEACASKILEVGPAGAKFLGPVLIEVPHFASLRGQEREIIILRSETGDVWREDPMEADEALIEDIIRSAESAPNQYGSDDKENISIKAASSTGGLNQSTIASASDQQQQQQQQRLTRIVTTEFPQYFAIISRIRQEVHAIGPQGAVVDSQLVPKVQAIFTEGALTKRIKIGLQAQRVPDELVLKLFGSLTAVTFSPIVTIEPRRRKFHCPIKLKIPLPASYRNELAGNLRLLCSISAPQSRALWEDVTGVTPLSIPADNSSLMFTTTVSARFWLVHCRKAEHCQEITRFAQEIYRYLICVPYMAKFVIFAKRRDINEAILRVFCMTDDKEERTLEVQEHYTQVAKSRDVEVLDGQPLYLEFGGNLVPTHLSGQHRLMAINSSALINEQLSFLFHAFQENRLAFAVRLREVGQEPSGRIAFMEDSMKYLASLTQHQRQLLAERRRRAVCTLGLSLPVMCVNQDNILGTPKRNSYYASTRIGDLTLADIANELDQPKATGSGANVNYDADSLNGIEYYKSNSRLASGDWVHLAPKLGIPKDEVEFISDYCATQLPMNSMGRNGNGNGNGSHHLGSTVSPALILLMHWFRLSSPDTRDQDLARALVSIKREDIAQKLNFPIEPKRISRSTMELLREIEMIPVRSSENLYANSEVYPASSRRRLSSASSRKTLDPATQVSQQTSRSRSSLAERTDSGNIASTTTGQQQRTGGGTLPAGSVATGKDANQPKGSGGKRSSGRKGHKS